MISKPPEGVHMQCTLEHSMDDAKVVRFTVRIWPLPVEMFPDFQKFMEAGAGEYLTKIGLVSGELIDLTKKGTLQ